VYQVLSEYLSERSFSRVVYVGDGSGDLHPCLMDDTIVFARKNYALHKLLDERGRKCFTWESERDLETLFEKHLLL
jgi:2-hydroxy-3-keto-5-methylthiopentenyl-1-phosphate phosphatase